LFLYVSFEYFSKKATASIFEISPAATPGHNRFPKQNQPLQEEAQAENLEST
jgi:hypothetical protein